MSWKVHLLDKSCLKRDLDLALQPIRSLCDRIRSRRYAGTMPWPIGTSLADRRRLLEDRAFAALPRYRQCDYCRAMLPKFAAREVVLSVSILCGALHGSPFDPLLLDLLRAHLAGDEATLPVLLDRAEHVGLGRPGNWARVEVDWPVIARHEHVWLPWMHGDESREMRHNLDDAVMIARCPCGEFEHERHDAEARCAEGLRLLLGPIDRGCVEDIPRDQRADLLTRLLEDAGRRSMS